MPQSDRKTYKPPFLTKVALYPFTTLVYIFYLVYLKTLRFECINFDQFPECRPQSKPALYVLWNSKCLSIVPCVMKSEIRYLTFFDLKHWILQKMTGMHDRKRLIFNSPQTTAFQVARVLRRGYHVGLAGDGPYGPPGILKEGAPYIAERTGKPIITLRADVKKSIRLRFRWDNFEIMCPFSKVRVTATEHVRKKGESMEDFRKRIETTLGPY